MVEVWAHSGLFGQLWGSFERSLAHLGYMGKNKRGLGAYGRVLGLYA